MALAVVSRSKPTVFRNSREKLSDILLLRPSILRETHMPVLNRTDFADDTFFILTSLKTKVKC